MKLIASAAIAVILIFGAIDKIYADEKRNITKVKEGYTVEELFSQKDKLKGKKVSVRGKVVKFNADIIGKNWLHLQDGTGKTGSDDITVTTKQTASVGDIVIITGVLATNKDIGSGYSYNVIIEEATIRVDK
ncbi:MAG: hypothetical protein A2073_03450 [Deltaproteobacteria bacterium GWC2_42_11]|nr:MAG: hypothetical protein A2073_03450 [Deltaproteobacteria bacterium GWC2_42_11]HBO85000.1 hypothetical protein [Deltaproteobacteria bacterium]